MNDSDTCTAILDKVKFLSLLAAPRETLRCPWASTAGRKPADNVTFLDYCDPVVTLSGCKCYQDWSADGETHYGTCHKDKNPVDPRGSWCFLDKSSCPGNYRAHQHGASTKFQGQGSSRVFTGLDWDFCQTRTQHGCLCSTSWTYAGVTMNGRCMKGELHCLCD